MIINVRIEHHSVKDMVLALEASLMVEGEEDAHQQGEEFSKITQAIINGIAGENEAS